MKGPISPDATLAHHIEGKDQLAFFFPEGALDTEVKTKVLESSPDLLWLGRSVLGQVGVDITADGAAVSHNHSGIYVPVSTAAYANVGRTLLDDLQELVHQTASGANVLWRDRPLPFGRLADMSRLVRQDRDAVQTDIYERYISFETNGALHDNDQPTAYKVHQDGSVSIKLTPLEFILNENYFLSSTEGRIGLLQEGRAAVARDSDHIYKDDDEPLPDFLLGGIRLSAGPRFWRILSQVTDNFVQLESAALFDADRLMGTGRHLPEYDRQRQVELRKIPDATSEEPEPTYGNTWIPVEFFRSTQVGQNRPPINWIRMTRQQRRLRHAYGVTALQALETADTANREALFAVARKPDVAALVLSRRGVQVVNETGSDKLNTRNTVSKLREPAEGVPRDLCHLKPLIEELGTAGDRTATVVAEQLRLEDIGRLVAGGDARAILFERFRADGSETMSTEELAALVDLSRRGIGIAWAQDGDYREFHPSGLWIKPGVSQRIEQLEVSVALFGARRENIAKLYESQIGRFLDGLVNMFNGPEYLAVVHGNGSGIMRAADEGARARGMLSFGVGIDVERLGQDQVNKAADGRMNMKSSELLIRQHLLEVYSTIPVITDGGVGTLVEIYNSLCFRKLLLGLPTPIIIVDPTGMYEPTRQQIENIAPNEIGEQSLPRNWLKNVLRFVTDFENGALQELANFIADPAGFWQAANIPTGHIRIADIAHRRQLAKLGMRLPPFMHQGVKKALGSQGA